MFKNQHVNVANVLKLNLFSILLLNKLRDSLIHLMKQPHIN